MPRQRLRSICLSMRCLLGHSWSPGIEKAPDLGPVGLQRRRLKSSARDDDGRTSAFSYRCLWRPSPLSKELQRLSGRLKRRNENILWPPHAFIFFPQVLQMANYALSLIARSCGSTCSPQNFVCAATCPGTADLLFQQPHCWVRREENIFSVPSANPPDLQIHQNRKISVAGIPPKSTIAQAASCI
jgi:hypothetical protein